MVSEDELAIWPDQTEGKRELMRTAEERSRDPWKAANDCEDALRRTEEAVAEAPATIKKSRARFRALAGGAPGWPPAHDVEAETNTAEARRRNFRRRRAGLEMIDKPSRRSFGGDSERRRFLVAVDQTP